MARPLRVEFPGALYFVTARTLPRQKLYRDATEAEDFLRRLPGLGENFGVVFHGFCLLPNHYHLLLETPREGLSRTLHRLNAGFTATTNAARKRKGPLLQSRYRALLIEEYPWLLTLSLHMHLNPLRRKLAALPWEYPWSSCRFFLEEKCSFPSLESRRVLALAGGRQAYREKLELGVANPPPAPWKDVWRQSVLGGDALRQKVLAAVAGRGARETPGFTARNQGKLPLQEVVEVVAEYTGMPAESVYTGKYQRVLARKVAMYLARRFTSLTLREIGQAFGVDYTTVHMVARRVEDLRSADPGVGELVTELEREVEKRSPTAAAKPAAQEPRRAPKRKPKSDQDGDSPQLKLF